MRGGMRTPSLAIAWYMPVICSSVIERPWPMGRLENVLPDHWSIGGTRPALSPGSPTPVRWPRPNLLQHLGVALRPDPLRQHQRADVRRLTEDAGGRVRHRAVLPGVVHVDAAHVDRAGHLQHLVGVGQAELDHRGGGDDLVHRARLERRRHRRGCPVPGPPAGRCPGSGRTCCRSPSPAPHRFSRPAPRPTRSWHRTGSWPAAPAAGRRTGCRRRGSASTVEPSTASCRLR